MTNPNTDSSARAGWLAATGATIFVLGVILALYLLVTVTTAQLDVALSTLNSETPIDVDMRDSLREIECPAAMGPDEETTIRFSVTNPTSAPQQAQIRVYTSEASRITYRLRCDMLTTFVANQSRQLDCDVSAANINGSTLKVEVPGIESHCGIAIIDGPGGLDGESALLAGFGLSLVLLLAGAGLWFLRYAPQGIFEWLRGILGILAITALMVGEGFALYVPNAYWKMVVAMGAFWAALLLTVLLLLLLASEGIVMRLTARREE